MTPRQQPAPTERRTRRVFTNRRGGHSAAPYASFNLGTHVGDAADVVRRNRARLARELRLRPEDFAWMEQLHTRRVAIVDRVPPAPLEATDAMVTAVPGVVLAVLTADCVPVLLADEEAGVVAVAHAGRVGAALGIVPATVRAMVEVGASVGNIHALLGPAASGAHYEVPAEMAADVEARLPGSRTKTLKGTAGLDIRRGLSRQLLELGVGGVVVDPRCTIADPDCFSYRREGTTGRQAGLAWVS